MKVIGKVFSKSKQTEHQIQLKSTYHFFFFFWAHLEIK